MVVLKDAVLALVQLSVAAVDFHAREFSLPQRADIKIVIEDPLHRDDRPCCFRLAADRLSGRGAALTLGHPRRGHVVVRQVVCNFFVAPAVQVEPENRPDDLGFRRHDLKNLLFVENVAIRRGAEPAPLLLPPLHDAAHLFRRVRDGHFVDQKLELDLQPVVVIREVDVIANRNDPHARIAQILQLYQSARVAAGKAGEVLDDENVVLVAHQPPAHLLIPLALLECVAGAVTILKKRQRAVRKVRRYKILNDGLLVFDRHIVAVEFLIDRNAGIPRNVKAFYHSHSPLRYCSVCRQLPRIPR